MNTSVAGSKTWRKTVVYIILILWTVISLFPVYWMLTFSLKTNAEIFGENVVGLPREWVWENYRRALNTGNMPRYFLNSLIVAVATIVITLAASVMATYAMTRLHWKGRKRMNSFFMLGLTIPIHASIVPLYTTLAKLKLLDTLWALIIPYSAFSLAMGILVCTGFMNEIPRELDEAATIDGCGFFRTLLYIIVPSIKTAMIVVGLLKFIELWNDLLQQVTYITRRENYTLALGLNIFRGSFNDDWSSIMCATCLSFIPGIVFYLIGQSLAMRS